MALVILLLLNVCRLSIKDLVRKETAFLITEFVYTSMFVELYSKCSHDSSLNHFSTEKNLQELLIICGEHVQVRRVPLVVEQHFRVTSCKAMKLASSSATFNCQVRGSYDG